MANALADAFLDDPLMVWLAGVEDPADRFEVLRTAMFRPAAAAAQRTGQGYLLAGADGAVVGVALWNPPETGFFSATEGEAIRTAFAEGGSAGCLRRLGALGEMIGQHHPAGSHFHLQFLGVTKDQRGQELGAQLVEPVLQRCDQDGLVAQLASSNPRNVSFYQRQGFEVVWQDAPEDGPLVQGMARPPRPPEPKGQ